MIGQKGIPVISGGVERYVQELSERLVIEGHEVVVFCRKWYSGKARYDGKVKRVFVPTIPTKNLDAIVHTFLSIFVAAWLKADIVHIHCVGPALLSWLPKLLRPSTKVVVTFQCLDRKQKKWGAFARLMLWLGERAACRFPDKTIVVSKTLLEYTRENFNADPIYIPNGVTMPKGENKVELIKRFDLKPDRYFIMVSRLVAHKGQKLLIRAWQKARLTNPKLLGKMKLAIVGSGAFTDEYVKEVKRLAAGDESIVLTGEQTGETLHALFANAYAAIHPSAVEGLPLAVLEAMSYGKCVLASNIPEHMEMIRAHGLSFRLDDPDDLVRQIIMMVEAPAETKHVGRLAAEFVKANYSWDEIAARIEMLYRNLLRERKNSMVINWLTRRKLIV
jgi:glycosyltransferase involved in cell wall biosynthesis